MAAVPRWVFIHHRIVIAMKPVRQPNILILLTAAAAVAPLSAHAYLVAPAPFDVTIQTGMGSDTGSLQWSIAADPSGQDGPNVLSELTYRDVKFSVFNASADINIHRGWLAGSTVFMTYRKGDASSGEVQDSDYAGNNRTQEYSRSYSSAEDSSMGAFEFGISHPVHLTESSRLVPAVAFAHHYQNMLMTDGKQVVDTHNPANLGEFRGTLKSSYNTEWNGLWAGFKWEYHTRHQQLSLGIKHYWLDYTAEADWNLRSDFAHPKSFEHWATGTGTGFDVSYQYRFSRTFSLSMAWYLIDWGTGAGTDKVYFADGSTGGSQLNEVTWESTGYNLGLQLLF